MRTRKKLTILQEDAMSQENHLRDPTHICTLVLSISPHNTPSEGAELFELSWLKDTEAANPGRWLPPKLASLFTLIALHGYAGASRTILKPLHAFNLSPLRTEVSSSVLVFFYSIVSFFLYKCNILYKPAEQQIPSTIAALHISTLLYMLIFHFVNTMQSCVAWI